VTFVFEPSRSLLIVAAVLSVAAILSLLLSRRNPARKAIGIAVIVVLVGIMLLRYRTAGLTVDDTGISADTYGDPIIMWSDVETVSYVDELAGSAYRPRPKLKSSFRIIGYGKARYGWFDAAGDEPVLFAVQRVEGPAVVVMTSDSTYVLGPSDPRGLAHAIAAYVPVSGLDAAP
jgi:hypothetical protein